MLGRCGGHVRTLLCAHGLGQYPDIAVMELDLTASRTCPVRLSRKMALELLVRQGMRPLLLGLMVVLQINGACGHSGEAPAPDAPEVPADAAPDGTSMRRCGRTSPDPGTGDLFARAKYGMVAKWQGTAT